MSWRITACRASPKPSACFSPLHDLLQQQVFAQPRRVADEGPEDELASARPRDDQPAAARRSAAPNSFQAQAVATARSSGFQVLMMPAAETSTRRSKRLGRRGHRLDRDEAAHRVADQGRALDPELLAEVVDAGGRRRACRSARRASGWPRSRAGRARSPGGPRAEVGQVLQPVLPAAGDAVDEDDRLALADLDVVDARPGQLDPLQVLPPVDPRPLRVGVAVVRAGDDPRISAVGASALPALSFFFPSETVLIGRVDEQLRTVDAGDLEERDLRRFGRSISCLISASSPARPRSGRR